MNSNTYIPETVENPEELINIKEVLILIRRFWYWILISIILGGAGALAYTLYLSPTYQMTTTIIVPKNQQGLTINGPFNDDIFNNQVSIGNEIVLLKSYSLNRRVIENLKWRVFWYKKQNFTWNGIYGKEPFLLQENLSENNAENIPVQITPFDNDKYLISVSGTGIINGKSEEIEFTAVGTYNVPFENQYFNFTLYLNGNYQPSPNEKYKFILRNVRSTTNDYLSKLSVMQDNEKGEVITLLMKAPDPLRGVNYLNELVKVYLNLKYEYETETQKRSILFIENQLEGISDSLDISESKFSSYRSKNKIINLDAQGGMVLREYNEIESQKTKQQMQLDYFKNLRSYLSDAEKLKHIVTPSVVGIDDPSLSSLVQNLNKLYRDREVLSFSAKENNPSIILMNKDIDQVTDQLRENLMNLIYNAESNIESLNKRYWEINSQLNKLPETEQKFINIQREYKLTNEIYTFLLQKRAEIELALASTVVDVQIVDTASTERIVTLGKSKIAIILMGVFLGFGLPFLIIIAFTIADNKIRWYDEVKKNCLIPVIGSVSHSKAKIDLVVYREPTSLVAESYRTIRTNILRELNKTNGKIISIHSLLPNEGKTFNIVNLASIFALNNLKVLIIGSDLRKPRLQRIFSKINNTNGLSTYLTEEIPLQEIIQPSSVENLWVILSGPIPANPAEILGKKRFEEMLLAVKNEFDIILLDNAPLSIVSDGFMTGRFSDLNLFVLRFGYSQKKQIEIINEITETKNLEHASLIINDITNTGKSYGYGYRYGYKYKEYTK